MLFDEGNLAAFMMKLQVPMFIASRKDEKRDGSSACLLYGYGGFNISLTPRYAICINMPKPMKFKRGNCMDLGFVFQSLFLAAFP